MTERTPVIRDRVAELEKIQADIAEMEKRAEARAGRKNGKLLPGERVDVQRMRRMEEKWETVLESAPRLLCPDCGRGPFLKRMNWCIIRGLEDKGGPPRVTCKGCVRTKFVREGKRLVLRQVAHKEEEGSMIRAVIRYEIDRKKFAELRGKVGLSQNSFAKAAGCTRGLVRRIEDVGPPVLLSIDQIVQFRVALETAGGDVGEIAEAIARHYGDYPDDPDEDDNVTQIDGRELTQE